MGRRGACRDCENCTNSVFVHGIRKVGRTSAFLLTYGGSEVVMALRRKCRVCGHQMSLHGAEQVAGVPQPSVEVLDDSGRRVRGWLTPPTAKSAAPPPTPTPPRRAPNVPPASEAIPPPPSAPPGWYYPDGEDAPPRYWDGYAWAETD